MPPRSTEANLRMRSESRARIVEHALRLFAQNGYDRTSVAMIARSAGVAQGLLYNYFESKDALLRAIFEQSVADVQESFAEAEALGTPRERIERLVRASFAIVRRHEAFWRLSYGVRMQAAVLETLGGAVAGWASEIRRRLKEYFAEAGSHQPALEAALLFALIDGISQHYVLDPEHYPLAEMEARLAAAYREGGSPFPAPQGG
jgi:AcrR family transcriptional regulator